jgi:uncharacterized protein (TIGR02996 family)
LDLKNWFRRKSTSGSRTESDATARSGGPGPTEQELRARIRANPNSLAPRLLLADALAGRGDRAKAAKEYIVIADTYAENDLHAKALRLLDKVLELVPGHPDVTARQAKLEGLEATLARRDQQIARLARRQPELLDPASVTADDLRRLWNEVGTSPFVADLSDDPLALFFAAAEVQQWTPLSIIVREGQQLPRCYMITDGSVEVIASYRDPRTLRRLMPGEVFGERALLDDAPWPARYRTEVRTTALRLSRQRFTAAVSNDSAAPELVDALRRHGRDREIEVALRT